MTPFLTSLPVTTTALFSFLIRQMIIRVMYAFDIKSIVMPDHLSASIHVVWGIPKGHSEPAVLVTAYRPNLEQWQDGFIRRRG